SCVRVRHLPPFTLCTLFRTHPLENLGMLEGRSPTLQEREGETLTREVRGKPQVSCLQGEPPRCPTRSVPPSNQKAIAQHEYSGLPDRFRDLWGNKDFRRPPSSHVQQSAAMPTTR